MKAHHTEPARVEWADTDSGGLMHFTAGFRYAERAEAGLRRSLGLLDDWGDYPRRAVDAEYHVLPRFDDVLEVRIRLETLGRTSITWTWQIWRAEELCVEGRHSVVHVNAEQAPEPLPPQVRAGLETLLHE